MTIINTLPFNLQNGTTADATQVDANFNEVVNDVNTNAAHNGVNNDITALFALTTPITPAQGGTNVYVGGTSTGSANGQIIASPVPTGFTLTIGNSIRFTPGFTNVAGSGVQLVVNGTAATALLKITSTGLAPLTGGELVVGQATEAYFDGTEFVLFTNAAPPIPARFLQNYLTSLTLSTAGSSSTFSVTAGECVDLTNASIMLLPSAYSKTTASWAVGSTNGALDTGSIAASTWYHVFIIQRVDTGIVDVLISLSPSSPTLPTNYTLFRRIGSIKTDGSSHWVLFTQLGDEFLWSVAVQDVNVSNLSTSATLFTLGSVPSGVQVRARLRGDIVNANAGTAVLINSTDESAQVADTPSGNQTVNNPVAGFAAPFNLDVRTSTSAQIRAVAQGASTSLRIVTYGWFDNRGK